MRKPVKVNNEVYELLDQWLEDTLTKDPPQARRIYASNVYQRALSLLMARYDTEQRPLMCEKDGTFRVVGRERIPCTMGCTRATIVGAATSGTTHNTPILRYGLWVYDYDVRVEVRQPGFVYDDYFVVRSGTYYEDIGYWQGIRLQNDNDDGAHDATIQLVVYIADNFQNVDGG